MKRFFLFLLLILLISCGKTPKEDKTTSTEKTFTDYYYQSKQKESEGNIKNKAVLDEPSVPYMLIYEDAKIVNRAVKLIYSSNLDSAKILLEEVISRTPENYSNDYFEDDKHYVEFWDKEEFESYINVLEGSAINAIQNAYPRAYYWKAWILAEEGDPMKAMEELSKALALEMDNPQILCEMGSILTNFFDVDTSSVLMALGLYKTALSNRDYIPPRDKARALRGQAVCLVELNRLEEAKEVLNESLQYANSQLAIDELAYIEHLMMGGERWKAEQVTTDGDTIIYD